MNTFICLVYLFIFNFGKYLSISVNTCLHPYICSYVCICKYLSMYVNMYISVHMICEYHQYMSMYVNMSISVHMCTSLNICLFMPTRKYLFICLYLWISLIYVNICQSVYICSYVCICKIFVYICQHANICSYVCIIEYCQYLSISFHISISVHMFVSANIVSWFQDQSRINPYLPTSPYLCSVLIGSYFAYHMSVC